MTSTAMLKKVFLIIGVLMTTMLLWKFIFSDITQEYFSDTLNTSYDVVIQKVNFSNGVERDRVLEETFNSGTDLSK